MCVCIFRQGNDISAPICSVTLLHYPFAASQHKSILSSLRCFNWLFQGIYLGYCFCVPRAITTRPYCILTMAFITRISMITTS